MNRKLILGLISIGVAIVLYLSQLRQKLTLQMGQAPPPSNSSGVVKIDPTPSTLSVSPIPQESNLSKNSLSFRPTLRAFLSIEGDSHFLELKNEVFSQKNRQTIGECLGHDFSDLDSIFSKWKPNGQSQVGPLTQHALLISASLSQDSEKEKKSRRRFTLTREIDREKKPRVSAQTFSLDEEGYPIPEEKKLDSEHLTATNVSALEKELADWIQTSENSISSERQWKLSGTLLNQTRTEVDFSETDGRFDEFTLTLFNSRGEGQKDTVGCYHPSSDSDTIECQCLSYSP